MFYYFGRKKQTAKNYPQPKHNLIIEPFAGSGAYSLYNNNWEKDVILIDNNPIVISIWNYLLNATEGDILNLPDLKEGDCLNDITYLTVSEKNLIGLHINPGSSIPKKTVTRFSRWHAGKKYILNNLFKIKHWNFLEGNYTEYQDVLKNTEATFFIDPPYYDQGKQYKGGTKNIDYKQLGKFILELTGQIIVCEGENHNNWLPFTEASFFVNNGGTNKSKKSKEFIFYREA